MTPERVIKALLLVADNVAKHTIQRSGWTADDACFQADLRESEAEINEAIHEAVAAEREACAMVAQEYGERIGTESGDKWSITHTAAGMNIAASIRARGDK